MICTAVCAIPGRVSVMCMAIVCWPVTSQDAATDSPEKGLFWAKWVVHIYRHRQTKRTKNHSCAPYKRRLQQAPRGGRQALASSGCRRRCAPWTPTCAPSLARARASCSGAGRTCRRCSRRLQSSARAPSTWVAGATYDVTCMSCGPWHTVRGHGIVYNGLPSADPHLPALPTLRAAADLRVGHAASLLCVVQGPAECGSTRRAVGQFPCWQRLKPCFGEPLPTMPAPRKL